MRHYGVQDCAFEDLPVSEARHKGRAPVGQCPAEKSMVEIAHDVRRLGPKVHAPAKSVAQTP
jgi:hypothetical protein